jgi:trigger factor
MNETSEAPANLSLERSIEIELSATEIQECMDKRVRALQPGARVNGFRAGNVPMSFLRKRYGPELTTEAVQELLCQRVQTHVDGRGYAVAGQVHVQPLSGPLDETLRYRVAFEVFPEFTLQGLDHLIVKPAGPARFDDQVQALLDGMRLRLSPLRVVDRPSRTGDRILVNYRALIGGEHELVGRSESVELGAGGMLPEFERALDAVSAGADLTFEVEFPPGYRIQDADVSGRTAAFVMTVLTVSEREVLNDDDFAQACGVDGLEAVRQSLRASVEQQHVEAGRNAARDSLLAQLEAANDFPLPMGLVHAHARDIESHFSGGAPEQVMAEAKRHTKVAILLRHVVMSQGIEVDHAQVEARLREMVSGAANARTLLEQYRSNTDLMRQITNRALEQQAIDWLLARAQTAAAAA